MTDYIPQKDADFHVWQTYISEIIESNYVAWGISEADMVKFRALKATWDSTYKVASNKQNRTSADVMAKNDALIAYVKFFRLFVAQWLANNSLIANSERERMGLSIKSTTRTPVGIPQTCPNGSVDFSTRLQHTIYYLDELTPNSKAKPEGVHGCEVWIKIGDAPKSPSELTFLATDTRSPYVHTFDSADVGKIAHYWLRWVNSRGERGPWGPPFNGIIAG